MTRVSDYADQYLNSLSHPSTRFYDVTRDTEGRLSIGSFVRCREDATEAEELFTVLVVLNSRNYGTTGPYFGGRGTGVPNPHTGGPRKTVKDTRVVVDSDELTSALGYEPPFGDLIASGHITYPDTSDYQWYTGFPDGHGTPGAALAYPEGARIPKSGYRHITDNGMTIVRLELGELSFPIPHDADGTVIGAMFDELSA